MTHQLFEGKDHASIYQKYRSAPPDEVKDIVLRYLDEKVRRGQYYEDTMHSLSKVHT